MSDVNAVCAVVDSDSQQDDSEQNDGDDILPLSGSTTLKPVSFWGDQSKANALEPGIRLLGANRIVVEDEDDLLKSKIEGQRAASSSQVGSFICLWLSPLLISL